VTLSAYLPAKPFADWVKRQEVLLGSKALCTDLGVDPRVVYGWKNQVTTEGEKVKRQPREVVEDALHALDKNIWDLYPDEVPEDEVVEGYCTRCEERVPVDGQRQCLWCDTLTSHPMTKAERDSFVSATCPGCGGHKGQYSKRCRPCATEARHGQRKGPRKRGKGGKYLKEPGSGKQFVCPSCGGKKANTSRVCIQCFRGMAVGRRQRMSGSNRVRPDQLRLAHELYEVHGLPMPEVVDHIEHGYKSRVSAVSTLYRMFERRRWHLRTKSEATYLAIARNGWLGVRSPVDNLRNRRKLPTGNRSGSIGHAKT
jgi:hypothetical protein